MAIHPRHQPIGTMECMRECSDVALIPRTVTHITPTADPVNLSWLLSSAATLHSQTPLQELTYPVLPL
jgi:hypothetical protein